MSKKYSSQPKSGGTIGNTDSPDALIIGGGLAGLAAAVELSSRGYSIVLAERKQHAGGRTYSFIHSETGDEVDNGQHLMMGCYHATLHYLHMTGGIDSVEIQDNLSIVFRRSDTAPDILSTLRLPAPLHVLAGLLRLNNLTVGQRMSLLRVGTELLFRDPDTDDYLKSITVSRWLEDLKQPAVNKKYLWDIIAIGALNDSTDRISAALFAKVLKSAFFGSRMNASMVIPVQGLSAVLIDPALKKIGESGGTVLLNTGVIAVASGPASVTSVALDNGLTITPRAVISAVPYFDIPRLFAHPESLGMKSPGAFVSSPIVTIHLWFDAHFVKEKFAALIDSPLHWVFNKTLIYNAKKEGLMYLAVVVSGAHDLIGREKEALTELAHNELKRFYPSASVARVVHSLVIKEKRATFSPSVSLADHRPSHKTSIPNLFLAGDWTDTKLPATIEGAVQSGFAAADLTRKYLDGERK